MRSRLYKALVLVALCSSYLCAQNVTLTGTIQGANGLPAKNTTLSFTPTQTFFVPGTNTAQQVVNIYGNGVPTGACAVSGQLYTNTATTPPSLYQCIYGAWLAVGGGGGSSIGSGTAGQFAQYPVNGTSIQGATLSGDASLAIGGALTLATVNTSPGSCGDATHVSQFTVNGKGLTTSCTPVAINFPAGALFPGANGIVFNTSPTASRNALFSDVVSLWASGLCSGYLKSDGTCGAGGGSSSGAAGTIQSADGSGGFSSATPQMFSPYVNSLVSNFGTWNYGDSTVNGAGASTSPNVFGAQLHRDVPGPWINQGVSGDYTTDIASVVWATWNPTDTFNNPLVTYEGGINDANNMNTTGGVNNAILATTAGVTHIAIPIASQMMASAAAHTGTWAAVSGVSNLTLAPVISGTIESSTTNGSTSTYTLPAGAKVAYWWVASDASAGTFTVSVNGTLQTNLCTGTTTFDAFGCNGQTITRNGGYSFFSQVFNGNAGGTNTVVVSVTSSTGASNKVYDVAAATVPSSFSGTPLIAIQGVLRQYLDASSAATASYNTGIQSVYTNLFGDGFTRMFFVDVRNGVPGGIGYPGAAAINTTTDFGGTGCAGGATPLHLADCGYYHLALLYESAAAAAGFPIAINNTGNVGGYVPGPVISTGPVQGVLTADYTNDWKIGVFGDNQLSTTSRMPGIMLYNKGYGLLNTSLNGRIVFEYIPSIAQYGIKLMTASQPFPIAFCTSANLGAPIANDACSTVFTQGTVGTFFNNALHIGSGMTNIYSNQPGTSVNLAYFIDSQKSITNGTNTPSAVTNYVTLSSTFYLPACKPITGNPNASGNWIMYYIADASTPISMTFNPGTLTTDLINGQSSVTYNNVQPFTRLSVFCSQSTETQSNISIQVEPFSDTTNASNITSGTLADARLSSNVPLLNANNTFSNLNQFTDEIVVTNGGASELLATPGSLVGNHSGTNIWSISNSDGSAIFASVTSPALSNTYLNNSTTAVSGIKTLTGNGTLASGTYSVAFPGGAFTNNPVCTLAIVSGGTPVGTAVPNVWFTSKTSAGFVLNSASATDTNGIDWTCTGN